MTFVNGKSGNPGGRPKLDPEVKAMWSKLIPEAIKAVTACLKSESEDVRLKAAGIVFDRNWGKPAQAIEATGEISLIGIKLKK